MRLLFVAALLLCAPTVYAADADALREAKDHYDRGMAHYELGEFTAAVEEFKAAYARSQAPGLLFNLAQANRLAKDYEQALHFYRTYLRVRPEAANREDVERRIAELEPIVQAQRRAELDKQLAAAQRARAEREAPPPAVVARSAPPPVARPLPPGGKKERVAGLVVGALGLGALGTGVGFGLLALDAQNKLSRFASTGGDWTPQQQTLYRDGQRDATLATALYAAGGVAVATGVVLYVVGWRKDRARRFALVPAPGGGAQAVWSCAF
jgi:tetratricopeptide (TPR) repeat protein